MNTIKTKINLLYFDLFYCKKNLFDYRIAN